MGQFDCKGWLASAYVIEIKNTVEISEQLDSNDCALVLTKKYGVKTMTKIQLNSKQQKKIYRSSYNSSFPVTTTSINYGP